MKTDDAVDQERIESARDRVSARLAGLLIDAMMGIGRQRGALPVSKYMTLSPAEAAPERPAGLVRLAQQREVDTETAIGGLRPPRPTGTPDRPAGPVRSFERGRDVSQHAALGRNLEPRNEFRRAIAAVRRSPPDRRSLG